MKTDPRAYAWTLTPELARTAGQQGLGFADIYLVVCKQLNAKGDQGCTPEQSRDFVELIDPDYIRTWVRNNVIYAPSHVSRSKVKTYSHLRYHGREYTATELSNMTGLQKNTLYIYWSKCNKDPVLFDMKIDKRLEKNPVANVPEINESWEVSI